MTKKHQLDNIQLSFEVDLKSKLFPKTPSKPKKRKKKKLTFGGTHPFQTTPTRKGIDLLGSKTK